MNLEKINQRYKKALQLICEMASGLHKFTMSIPADVEQDTDLVISSSLKDIPELIDEIKRWEKKYYDRCDYQLDEFRKDGMITAAKRCVVLTNDCATGYEAVEAIEREFKL